MILASDLIAARALIDTPEKFAPVKWRVTKRIFGALGAPERELAVYNALTAKLPNGKFRRIASYCAQVTTTHNDVLALYDRALAAAERADKP